MKTASIQAVFSRGVTFMILAGCGADGSEAESQTSNEQANIFITECTPNPCGNGGTCADTLLGFECSCIAGYTGALCNVPPGPAPVPPPPAFPPLFPSSHTLQLNVPQTLPSIVAQPEKLLGVTVSVDGEPCAGGTCTVPVAAGAVATVDVSVRVAQDAALPVLRAWDGCAQVPSAFEHLAFADGTYTLRWTTTFSNLDSDRNCSANFAQAAFFWFHLPAFGPSIAQASPAQYCDYVVDPSYVPQVPAGAESWSTSCLVPPGTTVTLTPIYQGRQLSSMVCNLRESATGANARKVYDTTPVVITDTRSGQLYECALDKLPE
jgi:hypothetical protein